MIGKSHQTILLSGHQSQLQRKPFAGFDGGQNDRAGVIIPVVCQEGETH